jgi:signal transduction histidine kinase
MSTRSASHIEALEVFVDVLSQEQGAQTADAFYSRLCEAVCRLTSMDRAVIFRYDSAERRVRAAGAHPPALAAALNEVVTIESAPIARRALVEDRVLEAWDNLDDELPAGYAESLGVTHIVCTPMVAAGRAIGVIVSDRNSAAPPLAENERDLLWTLGKTAALAAIARIATTHAQKAKQLEQRIDMAREIHDRVIQRLFGVSLALSGAQQLPADARARCAEELQLALADLRTVMQRPLGRAPRPTDRRLIDELARLVREHPDLRLELENGDPAQLPAEIEPLAQGVLIEAIRNAHKHARPTRVTVSLEHLDGAWQLAVTNDGIDGRPRHTGMGLRLAAFEALQSGGMLEFGEDGEGLWRVQLLVPDEPH